MSSKRLRRIVSMVAVVAAIGFGIIELTQSSDPSTATRAPSTSAPTSTSTSTTARPVTTPGASPTRASDLPTISIGALPDEALDTLVLIQRGGPFPYPQDGEIFANREGRLPQRSSAYYREYTVDTPGSPDRGARRIIVGADGDRYYTSDHYDSFREIVGS